MPRRGTRLISAERRCGSFRWLNRDACLNVSGMHLSRKYLNLADVGRGNWNGSRADQVQPGEPKWWSAALEDAPHLQILILACLVHEGVVQTHTMRSQKKR